LSIFNVFRVQIGFMFCQIQVYVVCQIEFELHHFTSTCDKLVWKIPIWKVAICERCGIEISDAIQSTKTFLWRWFYLRKIANVRQWKFQLTGKSKKSKYWERHFQAQISPVIFKFSPKNVKNKIVSWQIFITM